MKKVLLVAALALGLSMFAAVEANALTISFGFSENTGLVKVNALGGGYERHTASRVIREYRGFYGGNRYTSIHYKSDRRYNRSRYYREPYRGGRYYRKRHLRDGIDFRLFVESRRGYSRWGYNYGPYYRPLPRYKKYQYGYRCRRYC